MTNYIENGYIQLPSITFDEALRKVLSPTQDNRLRFTNNPLTASPTDDAIWDAVGKWTFRDIVATALQALNADLAIAGSTEAGLPTPGTRGRLREVTDSLGGVRIDNGLAWNTLLPYVVITHTPFKAPTDGVTDAYPAVNAANTEISTLANGGALVFPAGVYLLNSSFIASPKVLFILMPGAIIKTASGMNFTVYNLSAGNERHFSYTPLAKSVTSITSAAGTATVTLTTHGYITGDHILVNGAGQTEYNGIFEIIKVNDNTFTYKIVGTPTSPATGTITATRNSIVIYPQTNINPLWFTTAGDGRMDAKWTSTDGTAGWQAALDALQAFGVVCAPSGWFEMTVGADLRSRTGSGYTSLYGGFRTFLLSTRTMIYVNGDIEAFDLNANALPDGNNYRSDIIWDGGHFTTTADNVAPTTPTGTAIKGYDLRRFKLTNSRIQGFTKAINASPRDTWLIEWNSFFNNRYSFYLDDFMTELVPQDIVITHNAITAAVAIALTEPQFFSLHGTWDSIYITENTTAGPNSQDGSTFYGNTTWFYAESGSIARECSRLYIKRNTTEQLTGGTGNPSWVIHVEAKNGPWHAVSTITRSGSTATVTQTGHGYVTNDYIRIKGADQDEYNGIFFITKINDDQYSYTVSGTPATPATGTVESVIANNPLTHYSIEENVLTVSHNDATIVELGNVAGNGSICKNTFAAAVNGGGIKFGSVRNGTHIISHNRMTTDGSAVTISTTFQNTGSLVIIRKQEYIGAGRVFSFADRTKIQFSDLSFVTVASIAGALTIPEEAGTISLTGANTVTSISVTWAGHQVVFIVNSAGFADANNLKLVGAFTGATNSTISMICDGTNFIETGRTAPG